MVVALFLALLAAHCVADFSLQSDVIARNKGEVLFEAIGFHCLTAHAVIHAGLTGLVVALLGFPWLLSFLAVGVSHWVLDFCKSWRGFTWHLTSGARKEPQTCGLWGINVDQILHLSVLAAVALALVQ